MTHKHFLRDHVHAHAADAGRRPGEVLGDDVLPQTHRLEHLRTVIALNGRNAHLGHHLDHTLGRGLRVVLARELRVDVGDQPLVDHAFDCLEGEIRVHHGAAVADEQREVVHFARLAGLERETQAHAQPFTNQIVVQAAHRKQRRHRRELPVNAAIAKDENVHFLVLDHASRREAQLFHRLGKAFLAARGAEEN